MIRLLIADDHQIFRQGLKRLLADYDDLRVVAEAANYPEALEAVRKHDIDVATIDLTMPGRDGTELIPAIKDIRPRLRTLVLTMHGEDTYVTQAFRSGADGYMTKESAASDLVAVIRRIAAGGRYVSPEIAGRLTFGFAAAVPGVEPHKLLSAREFKIFQLLVAGKRGHEIAQELSLSEKTVSTHKAHVLIKLNLANQTDLVLYAIRHQLMQP